MCCLVAKPSFSMMNQDEILWSKFNTFSGNLCTSLENLYPLNDEERRESFALLRSNRDRILFLRNPEILKELEKCLQYMLSCSSDFRKDVCESHRSLLEAKDCYQQGRFKDALEHLSKAIKLAPIDCMYLQLFQ